MNVSSLNFYVFLCLNKCQSFVLKIILLSIPTFLLIRLFFHPVKLIKCSLKLLGVVEVYVFIFVDLTLYLE